MARNDSMSSSSRRAWFSCASRPVSLSSRRRKWPGLDDLRADPQAVAVVGRLELDLLDVEAALVQPLQPLLEPVALVGAEVLLGHQLVPDALVLRGDLRRELERVVDLEVAELRLEVEQLAGDVLLRDARGRAAAGRRSAGRAARRSRRRRRTRRACARRVGRACSRASSRPSRTRRGAGARAGSRAR